MNRMYYEFISDIREFIETPSVEIMAKFHICLTSFRSSTVFNCTFNQCESILIHSNPCNDSIKMLHMEFKCEKIINNSKNSIVFHFVQLRKIQVR